MVILTEDKIRKFLGRKKFWQGLLDQGWTINVFIYTDGSGIDIAWLNSKIIPTYKRYENVTVEVNKWVSGKITDKEILVDKLSDIAAKCVKKWGLNKKNIKVNKSEIVENPKQVQRPVSNVIRPYEINDGKRGKSYKELKGYKEISKIGVKELNFLNIYEKAKYDGVDIA